MIGVITITGIGDHLRPEWPIIFTGMRTKSADDILASIERFCLYNARVEI